MAWNRPTEERKPQKRESAGRGLAKGAAAGLLVAGGALVAWLLLSPVRPQKADGDAPRDRRIREQTPASVPAKAAPTNAASAKPDPNARPTKVGEVLNGYVKLANGQLHRIRGEITNGMQRAKAKYAIFEHPSENAIAGILSQKPGMNAIGTVRYGENFKRDFLESLKKPIEIGEEDSDETKELKQAVIEAKAELKSAYDRGEDIGKIMEESRNEIKRLASYQLDIKQQVMEYARSEGASEDDVRLFIKAANEMLAAKGIAPLKETPFVRIKAKMLGR